MSIELVILCNHLVLCQPLLLPSIFPSIRVFSSESVLHIRWPEYWSFSFSISPSNEYSGLISFRISFRIDWIDWCPRDSQESSPAPQLESNNSSVLNFLYCPTLISIHDYWKNHGFSYMDLCQQSDVSGLVSYQDPAINFSLLQTPTFWFVWPYCVLGTLVKKPDATFKLDLASKLPLIDIS